MVAYFTFFFSMIYDIKGESVTFRTSRGVSFAQLSDIKKKKADRCNLYLLKLYWVWYFPLHVSTHTNFVFLQVAECDSSHISVLRRS